ncbi:MAG TPA: DUF6152 family protein [Gammaproteobacteria bacterium]|nr:DUF6152 family protein [Gammaproteobacteria bacterium]
MRFRIAIRRLAAAAAALAAPAALAHHSFAPHFDASKPVSISGTVMQYEARNPHSYLHIAAVDENGKTQEYVCESHGVTQLTRNGITPEMLEAGAQIRVTGSQSRTSAYRCFFDSVELADGRKLSVNGPQGGTSRPSAAAAQPARKDIFGTWLLAPIPNRSTSGPQPMMKFLTPAGQKAVDAYDPFKDDPTFRCDPVAIRRVWGAPGTPLEIVRDGADVVLHHEWMDVRRVVHVNMKEHPKDAPRTSLGHSIGHFEGDTLVIETASYAPGVLNQYVEQPGQPTKGLLHSAALTSVERVHLDAARQRLVVEIDLADPEFFTQPFSRATYEYAPSELEIQPFNCSPETAAGSVRN